MVRRIAHVVHVVGLALLATSSANAQQLSPKLSANASVYNTNLNTEENDTSQRLTGYSAGVFASAALGRLGMEIRYLEGSLSPDGAGADRDIVEGEAMLTVRTLSWLSVQLGPHIRSFVRPIGTERWLFWEGRLRAGTRLGTPRLASTFEYWQVLSASVDAAEAFDRGQGLSGDLRWEVSSLPIWFGLGYRIDRSRLGGGARTEVLEHILFSVGFGRGTAH